MNKMNDKVFVTRWALGALIAGTVALQAYAETLASGFLPSGKFTLGANYWASRNATKMWREWDEAEVEKDLIALKEAGLTMLRVFPNWSDFQPIVEIHRTCAEKQPGETVMFLGEERRPDTPAGHAGVDERMMERFETFCRLSEKHGFRLIVCIINGQMTFRIIQPPAYEGKNIFTDPYALKWEARFVDYFVKRTRHLPAIAAWEVGDECIAMELTPHRNLPEVWMRFMNDMIRRADGTRPVIGQNGIWINEHHGNYTAWNVLEQAEFNDFLTTHPYGMWGEAYNDDFMGVRSSLFCASHTKGLEDISGRPAFIEEHGARFQEQANRRNLARYARGMLWNAWAADCRAMLWWCAFNQTDMEFPPYDWPEPCLELGAWTRDRTPEPIARTLAGFAAFQKRLPFEALPKARADALFIVDSEEMIHSSYVLARQAGIMPEFQSPQQEIRDAGVYFLPSAAGRANLRLRQWNRLKEKVRGGATLYLSLNDTFLDSLDKVAGIEVAFRERRGGEDVCDFGDFRLKVPYEVKRRYQSLTAKVLARNQDGEGVFFVNDYGQGKVYAFAHDIERSFYAAAGQYAQPGWKVYRRVCAVSRAVTTEKPDILVSEHPLADGRIAVIAVNNDPNPYEGRPTVAEGHAVVQALTDDESEAAWDGGRLRLAGNAGILLMLGKTDGKER